jgi:hypothetical protein
MALAGSVMGKTFEKNDGMWVGVLIQYKYYGSGSRT